MRYYKQISGDYILSIGTGNGFEEISQTEYEDISGVINNKPECTDTIKYHLRTDLKWEAYEVEPEQEQELDVSEAWEIIFGGGGK